VSGSLQIPGPEIATDLIELAEFGCLIEPALKPLAFADPIPDEDLRPEGEAAEGVAVTRAPAAMLRDDPELWSVWTEWCDGVREIDAAERRRRSNFEIEARNVLTSADTREQLRRLKRPADGQS